MNRRARVPSSPGRGAPPARRPGPGHPVSVPQGPLLSHQTCCSLPQRGRGSSSFAHLSRAVPLSLTALQFRTVKSKRPRKLRTGHQCDDPFPLTPGKAQSAVGTSVRMPSTLTDPRRHSVSGAPGSSLCPLLQRKQTSGRHFQSILIVPEGWSEVESWCTGSLQDYRPGRTVCPTGALPGPPGPTPRPPRCRRGRHHRGPWRLAHPLLSLLLGGSSCSPRGEDSHAP